ncbi:MAG: glycosyltransferase, partial [Lachnospiraceae bacterium]|nr:glycosyltransferase [Lachnospiraceae bacterium]
RYPRGVNLVGNIKAETGLGQSCRLVASALEKTEIPMSIVQYTQLGTQKLGDNSWDKKITDKLSFDINLIHINPHELGITYLQMEKSTWDYRYNIAYWLWELEEFPDEWVPCFHCLNEIWAPSEFICKAIRKKTNLPVYCMPYHVEAEIHNESSRKDFDLPEKQFLFLMMYDHSSCMERKNPLGVLNAFKEAFKKENRDVGLVIKINNSTKEDEEKIGNILDGYTNVYLIKETLDRDAVNSLTQCVDAVVSLHRAEGFGLVLAEAMLLGTPAIATNWSSNTEFMNEEVACMVDYKMVTIEKDMPPFKAGNQWADPDIHQAAAYMRKLYEDEEFYRGLAERAKAHVKDVLSMERAAGVMKERLENIYEMQIS